MRLNVSIDVNNGNSLYEFDVKDEQVSAFRELLFKALTRQINYYELNDGSIVLEYGAIN